MSLFFPWPWQRLPARVLAQGQHCRCAGTITEHRTSGLLLVCPVQQRHFTAALPSSSHTGLVAGWPLFALLCLAGENNQNSPKQTEAKRRSWCGSSPQNLGVLAFLHAHPWSVANCTTENGWVLCLPARCPSSLLVVLFWPGRLQHLSHQRIGHPYFTPLEPHSALPGKAFQAHPEHLP